ncbi:mechanosensitive ion channel protein MscS [Seonamhaeicola sp. S2-3]|uniref:mechanosensitive ion channel family protein n=1 Tax=Seonamhaeicola sp. S2-3 TaxID=1936081 RepID=UPI00097290AB|nr:mechanosensitive ion channel domain-containing protein [Seonamhaeicola sp. S2-3]APY09944.1 mechanosensitive ion channel protein MscS [Seonamhaeicola sp. S2-3]
MENLKAFLNESISITDKISISVKGIILVVLVIFITSVLLNLARKLLTRKLPTDDKDKFKVLFGYGKWLVYLIILLITFNAIGVNVTAIFAASAALLIGVGLALQTLFQDIIAGVLILLDQTIHVGDIIEIDGKVGRVDEVKLRTTRAVTIDNKVLIIPHHLYLTNSLYNWTQNGTITRESITVGVAYGSDVELVKKLLIEAANNHPDILKQPEPLVLFNNFGDSALEFKLIFTLSDSFQGGIPKSDLRFEIDRVFRENNISIPFPQRDVHIIQK